jgi:hypothetical protein
MSEESNLENKGVRNWVPLFLYNEQEIPCPERHEYDGIIEALHHLTGKLFPQEHDAKQCSASQAENFHQAKYFLQKGKD